MIWFGFYPYLTGCLQRVTSKSIIWVTVTIIDKNHEVSDPPPRLHTHTQFISRLDTGGLNICSDWLAGWEERDWPLQVRRTIRGFPSQWPKVTKRAKEKPLDFREIPHRALWILAKISDKVAKLATLGAGVSADTQFIGRPAVAATRLSNAGANWAPSHFHSQGFFLGICTTSNC